MQIFENIFSLPLGIFQTNRTYSKPLPKFVNLAGGGVTVIGHGHFGHLVELNYFFENLVL